MHDSLIRWIAEQFPHVVGLAMLPFERTMHEEFCIDVGWPVCREDWYPETCFEVRFEEIGRRLVAVYDDSEFGVGIGLYVVGEEHSFDERCLSSLAEFDEAFRSTLASVEPHLQCAAITGCYHCQRDDHEYKYAYWQFPDAFMTLVQHFEGDGHAGNDSSLDIRLVPRFGAARLTFPLKTNILF